MSDKVVYLNRTGPPPPVIILDRPAGNQLVMASEGGSQSAFMMGIDETTGDFHLIVRAESLGRLQEFARTLQAEIDARLASGGRLDEPASLHVNRALLNARR